jgi:hypothetical protein
MAINRFPPVAGGGAVDSVNGKVGIVSLTAVDVGAEASDPTILKGAAIGVSVQAYNADLTSWAAIAPSAKQNTLVSGTNIKTINGNSVLGSGNLTVTGAGAPMATAIVDLGVTPVSNASVTVTDAGVSAASYVQVFVMGDTTFDNNLDAHLHAGASWKLTPIPASGSFVLHIDALIDLCWGTFKIRYTYS